MTLIRKYKAKDMDDQIEGIFESHYEKPGNLAWVVFTPDDTKIPPTKLIWNIARVVSKVGKPNITQYMNDKTSLTIKYIGD